MQVPVSVLSKLGETFSVKINSNVTQQTNNFLRQSDYLSLELLILLLQHFLLFRELLWNFDEDHDFLIFTQLAPQTF